MCHLKVKSQNSFLAQSFEYVPNLESQNMEDKERKKMKTKKDSAMLPFKFTSSCYDGSQQTCQLSTLEAMARDYKVMDRDMLGLLSPLSPGPAFLHPPPALECKSGLIKHTKEEWEFFATFLKHRI